MNGETAIYQTVISLQEAWFRTLEITSRRIPWHVITSLNALDALSVNETLALWLAYTHCPWSYVTYRLWKLFNLSMSREIIASAIFTPQIEECNTNQRFARTKCGVPAWSPDGAWSVMTRNNQFREIDIKSSSLISMDFKIKIWIRYWNTSISTPPWLAECYRREKRTQ